MNEKVTRNTWIVAVAALAVGALALAAVPGPTALVPVKPQPEKISPITFHLYPTTSLQDRIAKDTEKTNAMLAEDLSGWRTDKALLPGYTDLRTKLIESLTTDYAGTYLAHPVLWGEDGVAYTGWAEIIAYLATIYPKAHYIHPQSVNVYLEYLPLANQTAAYLRTKLKLTAPTFEPGEIDFLFNVRTVIAYSPDDAPMEIGNATPIPHRKICDPIY